MVSAKTWVNHLPHMIIHMSSFLFYFTLFPLFIDILSPNNSVIECWHPACLFDNNGVCSFSRVIQQTVLFISKSVMRLPNTWAQQDLVTLGCINDRVFESQSSGLHLRAGVQVTLPKKPGLSSESSPLTVYCARWVWRLPIKVCHLVWNLPQCKRLV